MSYNIHDGESVAGGLELRAIPKVDRRVSERNDFRDQAANLGRESETPGQPCSQYSVAILSAGGLTDCIKALTRRYADS